LVGSRSSAALITLASARSIWPAAKASRTSQWRRFSVFAVRVRAPASRRPHPVSWSIHAAVEVGTGGVGQVAGVGFGYQQCRIAGNKCRIA